MTNKTYNKFVFDNIDSVRSVLVDIAAYIKSLDAQNITEDTRNELLKIHEDYYKIVDLVDSKLNAPRLPPEARVKLEIE
jgi:hypothetical protein